MLATDQREEKITTQTFENLPEFLLEDSNIDLPPGDLQESGGTSLFSSDSMILNIPSQVHLGLERVREAALEISKSLIKSDKSKSDMGTAEPRQEDVAVPLLDLMARHDEIPSYAATLGFAEDGNTIFHNFDLKESPHLLIVGGPDAGKTVMLRTIGISLALSNRQSEIQLAAIFPITGDQEKQQRQAEAVYALNYIPHMICDVAFKHSDILELLTFLSNEITYREERDYKFPHLVVLIDQVDDLINRGGRRCAEPILRLAQKGEEVGMHLVLSTQTLESRGLSTHMLKELPTRLIGRPPNKSSAQTFHLARDDEEEQLLGEGDFLYQRNGLSGRMQGAFIGDQELLPKLIDMNRHQAILLAEPMGSRLRLEDPKPKPRIKWSSMPVDPAVAETK